MALTTASSPELEPPAPRPGRGAGATAGSAPLDLGRKRVRAVLATPTGASAALVSVVVLILAVFAPIVWGEQAATFDTSAISAGPSSTHWLGTDALGRDIGLRVLVATRLAVGLALVATAIGMVLGLALGTVSAWSGPRAARLSAALIGVLVAFPGLLLAIFFAVIFGVGKTGAVLALGIAAAPWFARLVQTLVASVLELEYVSAARVIGVGRLTILRRHILPNISEALVVNGALGAGSHLLAFAGLSFLGIGVQAPDYDWGRLMLEGVSAIYSNPAGALGPGLAIVIAGLAFNLTGEAVASSIGGRALRLPRLPTDRTLSPAESDAAATGTAGGSASAVLRVRDLRVRVPDGASWVEAVRGVDLELEPGSTLGIVGESGSGKSLTAMAVAGLLPPSLHADAAELCFDGHDLRGRSERERRRLIGDSMSVIFQDPMSSLNPAMRIGPQLAEVARAHQGASASAARERSLDVLGSVHIPDPPRRSRQFPHEFSGGMRQRAMIAIGLMGRPRLVIADEPTTALDVTVQQQVLDLLDDATTEAGAARILISHDVAVIAERSDRVAVMYAGRVVEELDSADLQTGARHPYTCALLAAVPDMSTDRTTPLSTIPGRPPAAGEPAQGCAFAPRCAFATKRCHDDTPTLEPGRSGAVACWHPRDRDGGPETARGARQ